MKTPRKGWRGHYTVWLQSEGRDHDDHEYGAQCNDCPHRMQGTGLWLTETAGSRAHAWEIAKEHEIKQHGVEA